MRNSIIVISIIALISSCRPATFTPKPMGYYRLDTPENHKYKMFDQAGFPYTFEMPVYAKIEQDTAFFKEKADNPYWININFASLGGIINLTYKSIPSKDAFLKMTKDSYQFTFFHHQKADYINDEYMTNPATGVSYVLYTVGGNAASRYQFTATDSTKHFILGALYFDVNPNADSLQPATDFILQDIKHMFLTLKFR